VDLALPDGGANVGTLGDMSSLSTRALAAAVVAGIALGAPATGMAGTVSTVDPRGDVTGASPSQSLDIRSASVRPLAGGRIRHRVTTWNRSASGFASIRLELDTDGGAPDLFVQRSGRGAGVYDAHTGRRVARARVQPRSPTSFSLTFDAGIVKSKYRWRWASVLPERQGKADVLPDRGFATKRVPQSVGETPHLDVTITTDSTVALRRQTHSETEGKVSCGGADTEAPTAIGRSSTGSFCFQVGQLTHPDAETQVNYQINDSTDVLWFHSKVPFLGNNVVDCEIRKNGSDRVSTTTPFGCSVRWTADGGSGNNPKPKISVFQKPTEVVTDLAQARRLLNDNCGANQPQCTYHADKQRVVAAPRSQWRLYGSTQTNCDSPEEPDEHEVSQKQVISWSDTFGIKGGVKFSIAVVKAEVEIEYEHSIEEAHEFQEKHIQRVPYGKTVGFYLQPGVLNIVGDFLVALPDKVYSIKDFAFDIPLSGDYQPRGGGPRIVETNVIGMAWDADCRGIQTPAPREPGSPPPADAKRI
jgi:hypothetical protein